MGKPIITCLLLILLIPCHATAASLYGTVFHDYNGNGLPDPGEPGIAGAEVSIGSQSFISDETGLYWIGGLSNRTYDVSVKSPTDDPATAFRYISVFKGWVDIPTYEMNGVQVPAQKLSDAPVQGISEPISMDVSGETNVDIALMNGFLSLPFDLTTSYYIWSFVDLDHNQGSIRNYADDPTPSVDPFIPPDDPNAKQGTRDQHQGIDYNMYTGNYVRAMSPGTIIQSEDEYHYVRVKHDFGTEVFITDFAHNHSNLIESGQVVHRGQIIGLSGDWPGPPNSQPHIHAGFWVIPPDWWHDPLWYIFEIREKITYWEQSFPSVDDPYRDIGHSESVSYWTKDNDPQHPF